MIDNYYTYLIYGYHIDDLKPYSNKHIVVMCDECGTYRSMQNDRYSDICKRCSDKKNLVSASKTQSRDREPLQDGWGSKLSDITDNKECSHYLGDIAEIILSNIYDNVQVMPRNNHGFDVICNRDFKIDIKAAATGHKGYWEFAISKNVIANFFLCIAFESRDDLHNPIHLWMIPADKVNHLTKIKIHKNNLDKWRGYELSLDKLVACCDSRRA